MTARKTEDLPPCFCALIASYPSGTPWPGSGVKMRRALYGLIFLILFFFFYLFSATTNNVVVSNEKLVSTKLNECDCIYSLLSCGGCYSELGKIYTCTPKNLDYKRDVFCLNVMSVASYVLGSTPHKVLADEEEEPITVESRMLVETDIQRIKSVLMTLEERLCALESNFLPKGQ
ncbi:UNVERIFIED_CONTAM: hypothetical protein FKN15_069577 [Acipenser sinensis]